MRPNSIIRYARLREALYLDDDQAMAVQLARITVLYEDLRIELDSLRSFQNLAGPNDEFRVMYFIRRSLATLHEFIEAITELGKQPHFQSVEATWPEDARIRLKELRSELGSATQRVAILRNNVGGHFGEDGVAAALKHRKLWDAIAPLELDRNNQRHRRFVCHTGGCCRVRPT